MQSTVVLPDFHFGKNQIVQQMIFLTLFLFEISQKKQATQSTVVLPNLYLAQKTKTLLVQEIVFLTFFYLEVCLTNSGQCSQQFCFQTFTWAKTNSAARKLPYIFPLEIWQTKLGSAANKSAVRPSQKKIQIVKPTVFNNISTWDQTVR